MSPNRGLEAGKGGRAPGRRGPGPALPFSSTRADARVTIRSIRLATGSAGVRDALEVQVRPRDLLRFRAPGVCEVPEIREPQALTVELVGLTKGTDVTPDAKPPRAGSCVLPAFDPQSRGAVSTTTGCRQPISPGLLIEWPAVCCGIDRIMRQAFIRRGLGPSEIGADEAEGYLLEAERSRGIAPGNSEILAIFRRMPIELISRMRFDQRSRILAYTLVPIQGIGRSRIHDLAVLRDRSTGRTRWIPHRTRFQTAALA